MSSSAPARPARFADINLAAAFGGPEAAAQATASGGPGRIGVDYVPNMNADLRIVVPFQDDAKHGAMLASSGIDTNVTLPDNFSWHDQDSVRTTGRMSDYNASWLMSPPNQANCGSCWAVSSTSALTDRISIAQKSKCPVLAATVTASCGVHQEGGDGCQGGFPSDAGCFFETVGVPPDACWPYDSWCSPQTSQCSLPPCCSEGSGGGPQPYGAGASPDDVKGQRVTGCPDYASRMTKGQCSGGSNRAPGNPQACNSGTGGASKIYKAVAGSTRSLGAGDAETVFHRMKWNVYAGGPIVAGYEVYKDFMLPAIPSWGWKATNGIYIHAEDSPYAHDPFVLGIPAKLQSGNATADEQKAANFLGLSASDNESSVVSKANRVLNTLAGAHAVTVVGWGSDDTKHPSYGKVRYWWVRNSWGDQWNEAGYFRIAFTDTAKGINTACGFDYPKVFEGQGGALAGGATVFQVSETYHPHSTPKPAPKPDPVKKPKKKDETAHIKKLGLAAVVAAAVIIIIVLIVRSSKEGRNTQAPRAPVMQAAPAARAPVMQAAPAARAPVMQAAPAAPVNTSFGRFNRSGPVPSFV